MSNTVPVCYGSRGKDGVAASNPTVWIFDDFTLGRDVLARTIAEQGNVPCCHLRQRDVLSHALNIPPGDIFLASADGLPQRMLQCARCAGGIPTIRWFCSPLTPR